MRIIAGKARGLKLFAPDGLSVRPTADRVKESLFNILNLKLIDAYVLDLFSGSGNLGLEAWSRGAKEVICVDMSKNSLNYINRNIEKAKASEYVKIYRSDAIKSIEYFHKEGVLFDIIFCDPPYEKGFLNLVLTQMKKGNILKQEGFLIIESSKNEKYELPDFFECARQEKYGDTIITFIKNKNDI